MTIGEGHLGVGQTGKIAVQIHDLNTFADLANLAAVSPGVHIHAAADGSRYAVGEFHTGETHVCSVHRRPCHGHARHHPDVGLVQPFHAAKAILQADHQPPDTLIRRQHVGSRAQNGTFAVQLGAGFQDIRQFDFGFGKRHYLGVSADAKGGMLRQSFFKPKLHIGQ